MAGSTMGPTKTGLPRKTRNDSAAGIMKTIEVLRQEVVCPIKLNKEEEEVFNELIDSLPKTLWTKASIRKAANLSRTIVHCQQLMDDVIEEGVVYVSSTGEQKPNPKHVALMKQESLINSGLRSLGLHTTQLGRADERANAKQGEELAKKVINKGSAISLIA